MHVIVVGGGSAGCVVTRRLADAGHRVTLIEAGPGFRPPSSRSLNWLTVQSEPDRHWPITDVEPLVRGRGLGGSSGINGLVVDQPPLGHPMWGGLSEAEVSEAADRVLSEIGVLDEFAPTGLGRHILDLDDSDGWTMSNASLMVRGGHRLDAVDLFLNPLADGVTLVSDGIVSTLTSPSSVRLNDGREFSGDIVVLCAGAIGSPRLVLSSPALATARVGREIGRGLANHPSMAIVGPLRSADVVGPMAERPPITVMGKRGRCQVVVMDYLESADGSAPLGGLIVADMEPGSTGAVTAKGYSFDEAVVSSDKAALEGAVRSLGDLTSTLFAAPPTISQSASHSHPAASCRIGTSVDLDGCVFASDGGRVEGLHVIDAGAFAATPPVNPHLSTLVLADAMIQRALAAW